MEFAILGPIEVREDGRSLALGGPKQRALLAILLLHENEVVSRDRLIEGLWGERPPPSVDQSLDSYISRLRRLLGSDRLLRQAPGYLLRVEFGELDLDRFEELVSRARSADQSDAEALFVEALALWRGPALGDLLYEPFARDQAGWFEERRLLAVEERLDAALATGQGPELLPELERLVREHPLRERLIGQRVLALYRAGRQADALAELQSARQRLAAELGLEPGPQLRELERQILQHDPALGAAPSSRPPPVGGRRRAGIAAAVGVLGIAAAAAGLLVSRGSRPDQPAVEHGTNRLVAVSGRGGRTIDLAGPPGALVVSAGSLWAADANGEAVYRVDPDSGGVIDRIPVGGEPGDLAAGGGAIWAASTLGGTISRIDPATDTVTQTIPLGEANAAAIAFGFGRLWVADTIDRALLEVDPATGSVERTFALDLRPTALAVGLGAIWVAGHDVGTVEAIDPTSGATLDTVRVGQGPSAIVAGDGAVWVANGLDGTVSRIDPRTGSVVATVAVGSGPSALAIADGSIWAANTYAGTVARIDPGQNRLASTIQVGGRPSSLAEEAGTMWAGAGAQGALHRGGTLTLLTINRFATIDPAFYDLALPTQFTGLAYDTLVTFERAAGPDGLRLVPDLALAVPTPTDGGTTYVFRLRPGVRYSDGRSLRARDFRRAFERLFRLGSPGSSHYAGVVGASACLHAPARCDLARGIVTDDRAATVVFHLTSPDSDFLFKLASFAFSAPIPPGVPNRIGSKAVPGTGPYRIVRVDEHEIRFVRNPFFREWSHAAQPAGNPDAIVWRFARSHEAVVQAIEQGRADWTFDLIPPTELHELRTRRPAQLHENPWFLVEFLQLNTRAAPFDDVRARRALNYAIDRARIARMYGGRAVATPTCQPLIPRLPGYRRYCPYTLHPSPRGSWTAPDMARARRLVTASGTRGTHIDVWAATDEFAMPSKLPTYIAGVLQSIGYPTRLHLIPISSLTRPLRKRIQLSVDGDWNPDYPSPSAYIPQFFACDGGNGYYCDPHIDREMADARALQLRDTERAARLWSRIDRELVDKAVWVPLVDLSGVDFVSRRLRNYQFHPVWGFIADQVWLR